ncbi:hypothetical protein [Eubacterium ventriosum]|uniref:hypothetical protein n=1 Tax=Eubacterium ventriosum TaxID=39496 RepID=UPI00243243C4|nr:hypothetical protein [Eubacterium ventriosum]
MTKSVYIICVYSKTKHRTTKTKKIRHMCRELVYPIGRNRGESVAYVKNVISKGGKTIEEG